MLFVNRALSVRPLKRKPVFIRPRDDNDDDGKDDGDVSSSHRFHNSLQSRSVGRQRKRERERVPSRLEPATKPLPSSPLPSPNF